MLRVLKENAAFSGDETYHALSDEQILRLLAHDWYHDASKDTTNKARDRRLSFESPMGSPLGSPTGRARAPPPVPTSSGSQRFMKLLPSYSGKGLASFGGAGSASDLLGASMERSVRLARLSRSELESKLQILMHRLRDDQVAL
eukprot:1429078-Rhodomonas_salina.1